MYIENIFDGKDVQNNDVIFYRWDLKIKQNEA